MKLNLGCGSDYKKGWVNVDYDYKCDIKHNLNKYPFPFKDNTFDFILCSHTLEHIIDPSSFIMECYRILKSKGEIVFKLPVGCFNVNHLRIIHTKDIFKCYTVDNKVGQSGAYFDLIYQKRRLRSFIRLYYRFRNWCLNLISDEWEFRLAKK